MTMTRALPMTMVMPIPKAGDADGNGAGNGAGSHRPEWLVDDDNLVPVADFSVFERLKLLENDSLSMFVVPLSFVFSAAVDDSESTILRLLDLELQKGRWGRKFIAVFFTKESFLLRNLYAVISVVA